jgi:hypothetical protein
VAEKVAALSFTRMDVRRHPLDVVLPQDEMLAVVDTGHLITVKVASLDVKMMRFVFRTPNTRPVMTTVSGRGYRRVRVREIARERAVYD